MITEKDLQYIASLSRIHLKIEEAQSLTKNLEQILEYVTKLQKLDVSSVEPTSHVLPLENVFRDDEIKPSLNQADVLQFAVDKHRGFFKVPKVIE